MYVASSYKYLSIYFDINIYRKLIQMNVYIKTVKNRCKVLQWLYVTALLLELLLETHIFTFWLAWFASGDDLFMREICNKFYGNEF